MAKRTENDENLKRYQERLKHLQKEGLVPSPQIDDPEKLIKYLAAEGMKLLDAEVVAKPAKPAKAASKKTDAGKLSDTLGLASKNPYIRARIMVLKKLPAWKRNEIERMEQSNNLDNPHYAAFVREVAILGDELSNK